MDITTINSFPADSPNNKFINKYLDCLKKVFITAEPFNKRAVDIIIEIGCTARKQAVYTRVDQVFSPPLLNVEYIIRYGTKFKIRRHEIGSAINEVISRDLAVTTNLLMDMLDVYFYEGSIPLKVESKILDVAGEKVVGKDLIRIKLMLPATTTPRVQADGSVHDHYDCGPNIFGFCLPTVAVGTADLYRDVPVRYPIVQGLNPQDILRIFPSLCLLAVRPLIKNT